LNYTIKIIHVLLESIFETYFAVFVSFNWHSETFVAPQQITGRHT